MAGNVSRKVVVHKVSPYEVISDPQQLEFLNRLKRLWQSWKTGPQVSEALYEFFMNSHQPYGDALRLSYSCGEFQLGKPVSLATFIISTFAGWLQVFKTQVEHYLEPRIKIEALRLVVQQKNVAFRYLVIKTYDMVVENEIFLPFIRELISLQLYKDACQIAGALELHQLFSPEDFLVPLFIQDKLIVIEEHVAGDEIVRQQFVKYMDDLLAHNIYRILMDLAAKLAVSEIKHDKCDHKPLTKFLNRLIKTYPDLVEMAPNLMSGKKMGALQYLLARRFNSEFTGYTSGWAEMVIEAVGDSAVLQLELVNNIADRGLYEEANDWFCQFKLPDDRLPEDLISYRENAGACGYTPQVADSINQQSYLRLPPIPNFVVFVNDAVPLVEFFDALDATNIVGVDCEWKPSLCASENELALIQVATKERVYILDRPTLARNVEHFSHSVVERLFHNKKVLKLGFSMNCDLKSLKKVLPELKGLDHFLDLAAIWPILRDRYHLKFPYTGDPTSGKLTTLVSLTLGKELDKTEQFSNWENRPLRQEQLIYAALDAYCLLQIYDVLKKCCAYQQILFTSIEEQLIKSRSSNQKWEPESAETTNVSVASVKLVCTWELWPLVRRLRQCGISTYYIDRHYPGQREINKMKNETAILTTKRHPWLNNLRNVIDVPAVEVPSQLNFVLKKLKVEILPEEFSSRCQECNCSETMIMSGEDFKQLCEQNLKRERTLSNYHPDCEDDDYGDDDDDDYDEETGHYYGNSTSNHGDFQQFIRDRTEKGEPIHYEKVPEAVRQTVGGFFVCQKCGSVRWPVTLDDMFLYD